MEDDFGFNIIAEVDFLREKNKEVMRELDKLKQDYAVLSKEYEELKWRTEGLEK